MNAQKQVAILITQGGLLDAYPPLNLALAAAAMDAQVTLFFTFDGIKLLLAKSQDDLEAPANAPEMKQMLADKQMPSVPELLAMARESGVRLIACRRRSTCSASRPTSSAKASKSSARQRSSR